MLMVIYADLGECVMERRNGGNRHSVTKTANGRLVQIGGDRETVKVKPSSRHGSSVGGRFRNSSSYKGR